LNGRQVCLFAASWISQRHSGWARENSPIRLLPTCILSPPFFKVLATIEGQKREHEFMMGHKPYPNGEFWTEPSDPPDFRRFLSLRDEYPMCQTMLVTGRTVFVSRSFCCLSRPHSPSLRLRCLGCRHKQDLVEKHHVTIRGLTDSPRPRADLSWQRMSIRLAGREIKDGKRGGMRRARSAWATTVPTHSRCHRACCQAYNEPDQLSVRNRKDGATVRRRGRAKDLPSSVSRTCWIGQQDCIEQTRLQYGT
jgi:hypothetical protein